MSGKSRRRVGKYSIQRKKTRGSSRRPSIPTPPSAVAQAGESFPLKDEPVASPNLPVPRAGVPTPKAEPATVWYPYIATELRTIGILAGIMLIALVVLALVLS